MVSRSFWGMSPCIDDTVKFASRIFSVNQSTCGKHKLWCFHEVVTGRIRLYVPYAWYCKRWRPAWSLTCRKGHKVCRISIPLVRRQRKTAWFLQVSIHHWQDIDVKKRPKNEHSICVWNFKKMFHRLTKMRIGSVMNLLVISKISWGNVADRRTTYSIVMLKRFHTVCFWVWYLSCRRKVAVNIIDLFFETLVQHFVSFIQNQHFNGTRPKSATADHI